MKAITKAEIYWTIAPRPERGHFRYWHRGRVGMSARCPLSRAKRSCVNVVGRSQIDPKRTKALMEKLAATSVDSTQPVCLHLSHTAHRRTCSTTIYPPGAELIFFAQHG